MPKHKSPAFQIYPETVLSDEAVKLMDNRQFGVYMKLILHNWLEGSIPTSFTMLGTLVNEDPRDFEAMWPAMATKFKKKGSRLTNRRLEKERKKQKKYSQKMKENALKLWKGKNSEKSKNERLPSKPRHSRKDAEAMLSVSVSNSVSNSSNNNPNPFEERFEQFVKNYPNRDGLKAAKRHFLASVVSEQDWIDIQAALKNYLNSERPKKGFVKNCSTWFNNWRDWTLSEENKVKLVNLAASVNAMP